MYQRFGLYPYHGTVVAAAMVDTVRRFAGDCWEPELPGVWERGCRRVLRLAERAAGVLGDGPHVTVGEVEVCEVAADGVAVLTVRPVRRLRYRPGQAGRRRLPAAGVAVDSLHVAATFQRTPGSAAWGSRQRSAPSCGSERDDDADRDGVNQVSGS